MGFMVQSDCLGIMCVLIGPKHGIYAVLDAPANGILLHVTEKTIPEPTIFPTKRIAQGAIARTVKYGGERFGFKKESYKIITESQYEMLQELKTAAGRRAARKQSQAPR